MQWSVCALDSVMILLNVNCLLNPNWASCSVKRRRVCRGFQISNPSLFSLSPHRPAIDMKQQLVNIYVLSFLPFSFTFTLSSLSQKMKADVSDGVPVRDEILPFLFFAPWSWEIRQRHMRWPQFTVQQPAPVQSMSVNLNWTGHVA